MKTFYSIIKIAPNPTAGDSLAIGLLVRDQERVWLRFSDRKKKAAKSLLDNEAEVVDFAVTQLLKQKNHINKQLESPQQVLFQSNIDKSFNADYFNYLSRYCNGLLQFSPVSTLKDNILNQDKFDKLFQIFVDIIEPEEPIVENDTKRKRFLKRIETKLIERVKDQVHTNININQNILPSLFFNINIDCIGLNGVFTGAKAIPFDQTKQTIDTHVSHYITLINTLVTKYGKKNDNNKFFLIADEPVDTGGDLHNFWEILRKRDEFKLIHSEQAGTVAELIESSQAHTFLPVETVIDNK